MKFYAGQKLKFKEHWNNYMDYAAGEEVTVIRLDESGDPEIEGKNGMDYFYSDDLADLVEEVAE